MDKTDENYFESIYDMLKIMTPASKKVYEMLLCYTYSYYAKKMIRITNIHYNINESILDRKSGRLYVR